MISGSAIKRLHTQAQKARERIRALLLEGESLERRLGAEVEVLGKLRERLERSQSPTNPRVTEHAMLRYLEHVKGVDLAAVEQEVLPEKAAEMIRTLGTGVIPTPTHRLRVVNGTVVTVLPLEG